MLGHYAEFRHHDFRNHCGNCSQVSKLVNLGTASGLSKIISTLGYHSCLTLDTYDPDSTVPPNAEVIV